MRTHSKKRQRAWRTGKHKWPSWDCCWLLFQQSLQNCLSCFDNHALYLLSFTFKHMKKLIVVSKSICGMSFRWFLIHNWVCIITKSWFENLLLEFQLKKYFIIWIVILLTQTFKTVFVLFLSLLESFIVTKLRIVTIQVFVQILLNFIGCRKNFGLCSI